MSCLLLDNCSWIVQIRQFSKSKHKRKKTHARYLIIFSSFYKNKLTFCNVTSLRSKLLTINYNQLRKSTCNAFRVWEKAKQILNMQSKPHYRDKLSVSTSDVVFPPAERSRWIFSLSRYTNELRKSYFSDGEGQPRS